MTRILGGSAAAGLLLTLVLGLWLSPADLYQRDAVRLLYVHVPTAWLALYLSFGVTSLASALYLWRRTRSRFWDLLAGSSAEIGLVFLGLTLAVGSIWGRATWGVWWTWDARLTTTAVLAILYLGYLALRSAPGDPEVTARRSAVVALFAFADVPLIHFSVEWWRTLHQPASLLDQRRLLDPQITGEMAATLAVAVVAFTLLYAWLLVTRFRVAAMEDQAGRGRLAVALAQRHAEAQVPVGNGPSAARESVPVAVGVGEAGLVETAVVAGAMGSEAMVAKTAVSGAVADGIPSTTTAGSGSARP
ncbi:MAG: cytochrome c biogenesis protein CcsA [Acidimicrobiales bacterium]